MILLVDCVTTCICERECDMLSDIRAVPVMNAVRPLRFGSTAVSSV